MRLKEKTHRKFVEFFGKMSRMYQGEEFELAFSDIQRDTGTASVTLKRAVQALAEDGVIEVSTGRNSRYAKFRYLRPQPQDENQSFQQTPGQLESEHQASLPQVAQQIIEQQPSNKELDTLKLDVQELTHLINHLLRRVRNQEMTIALLQDRLAEVEDKASKK
ncbi:MAG: IclR family transcriptional regulator [Desulfitobacteriaceae bacterium]